MITSNSQKIVISLCDRSGQWSAPYVWMGYTVVRVDPMHDAGKATTEGTSLYGSGKVERMADGGWALAATAGQLAEALDAGRLCGLDPQDALRAMFAEYGFGYEIPFGSRIVGVLAAPPCTHFASSGARWFAEKDARGDTALAVQIVRECLKVVDLCNPDFWALENPRGRIARCVPELQSAQRWEFDPCDFAGLADDPKREAYTKRTVIWGSARKPMISSRVEPVMIEKTRKDGTVTRGSWMWANLGGKSERTKSLRSVTPMGFAKAFAAANL